MLNVWQKTTRNRKVPGIRTGNVPSALSGIRWQYWPGIVSVSMTTPIGSQFVGPYKLEGPAPDVSHPDVERIYETARRQNMMPFRIQGLVMDIGANYQLRDIRWFVTFTEDENGTHVFHEASGEGYLFGPNDLEAFIQHINVPIKEQAERHPAYRAPVGRPHSPALSTGMPTT